MGEIRRRVIVEGRVQGVGFRAATFAFVGQFPGLKGWVRNLSSGAVEAVFYGREDLVMRCVEWCGSGPPSARVSRVEVYEESGGEGLGPFTVIQ